MIRLIRFNGSHLSVTTPDSIEDLEPVSGVMTWIDIEDGDTVSTVRALSDRFRIHPLAVHSLDDDFSQPRLEEFEHHAMLNARVLTDAAAVDASLVRLIVLLGSDYIITVHTTPLKMIERTLERLSADFIHVLGQKADFVFYLLLDTLGDSYFLFLDRISEEIDEIDARATERYDKSLQGEIMRAKRRLLSLHRAIAPLRDALLNLRHTESPFISEHVSVYMRDAFENILQLLNMVETYREVLSNSSEMMMAAASNRMNETITFLTIISSFFIPLTFIAGFYGMNLRMPEALVPVTYPVVIGVMVTTVVTMFVWFRHKKWI